MAKLTLPDGTVVSGAPAGMSVSVFMSALKQSNPGAYRGIINRTANGGGLEPTITESVGRGMMDVVSGARQVVGDLSPEEEGSEREDIALYEKGVAPGFDIPRMAGQAAMLSPLGAPASASKTGMLARTAVGSGLGAAAGGLLFADEPIDRGVNVLSGMVGGGAASAAGPPISNALGKLAGGAREVGKRVLTPAQIGARVTIDLDDAARNAGVSLSDLGDDVVNNLRKQAARNLARTGSSGADDLLRVTRAESFGFSGDSALTGGQATRNPRAFTQEKRLAKLEGVGDDLETRYEAQRKQVDSSLDDMRARYGGSPEITPYQAGETVEAAAKTRAADMQAGVRAAYEAAEAAQPNVELPRGFFRNRVKETLEDFEDNVPTSVKKRINALLDPKNPRRFTPSEAAKLDKLITDTLPGDPFAKPAKLAARRLQEAIADTMEKASDDAGEYAGLYKAAKAAAAARFRAIGDPTKLTARLVTETMDPEKITRALMTGSVRQIRNLKQFLPDGSDAWEASKASVLNEIVDSAQKSGGFRQASYNATIKKIGRERLTILFGDEGADRLINFGKLARDLFSLPEGHAVNTSNTGSEIANLLGSVVDATTNSIPGGGVLSGLRAAGRQAAEDRIKARIVAEALTPPAVPIPNLAAPLEPYVRGAAPVLGGLFASDRK